MRALQARQPFRRRYPQITAAPQRHRQYLVIRQPVLDRVLAPALSPANFQHAVLAGQPDLAAPPLYNGLNAVQPTKLQVGRLPVINPHTAQLPWTASFRQPGREIAAVVQNQRLYIVVGCRGGQTPALDPPVLPMVEPTFGRADPDGAVVVLQHGPYQVVGEAVPETIIVDRI